MALQHQSTDPASTNAATARSVTDDSAPVVLDRRQGPYGEVVLRRHGGLLQIIANGCFLMDTSDGRSERLLVDAALRALDDRPAPSVLIGGLGVGFSLAHAAAGARWGRITVVEREQAVIDWHRDTRNAPYAPLSAVSARAVADARTRILHTDLLTHLRKPAAEPHEPAATDARAEHASADTSGKARPGPAARAEYDALCLDIDNGPDWTVTDDNNSLYSAAGLAVCRDRLTPGGVLAVWSAQPSPVFEETLRNAGFTQVRTEEIPVARGVPDAVHLAVRAG